MSEPAYPQEPIRNARSEAISSNIHQRPQVDYRLDGFHKTLRMVSIALAMALPVIFAMQMFGMTDLLPVRYGVAGEVLREGSVWEAVGGLILLGLGTIAVAVLAGYPRIFNYPITLTAHNAQRQYNNAARMMIWIACSMALIMVVMTASWLGLLVMGWIWAALGLLLVAVIFFLGRMFRLR